MKDNSFVSIIINNYNYGRFLRDAIDSALNQTYKNVEVIVVDDGSTDNSRDVIASYEDKITPILKENGGQASAFNTGFEASKGNYIIFLDSDDILLSAAAEKSVQFLQEPTTTKVHWPLRQIDEQGNQNGRLFPGVDLLEGDLRGLMAEKGPDAYTSSPTTGNAWSRNFLEKIFPIPAGKFKISADLYLYMLAPVFGLIKLLDEPQGCYRMHANNNFYGRMMQEKLKLMVETYDNSCAILKNFLDQLQVPYDDSRWKINSWINKFLDSVTDLKKLVREHESLIFVDEAGLEVGNEIAGRKVIPFLEHDGMYWGKPYDSEHAIRELERLRKSGASFIIFAWPAFWWLDYYTEMHDYLNCKYQRIISNDRLIGFSFKEVPQENKVFNSAVEMNLFNE